jgi:UDP-3-O-[3-hydroxymyristoyl] glucosamine N-acyltransferase
MHERQPSLSMSHALESSDDGTPTLDFEEELDESNPNRQTLSSMNGNENAAAQNGNKASDVHYPTDHDDAAMNNEEWWVDDRPHSAYMI